jgi:acyl-CoA synthetase (AMP-forming)/AMP-acid ligase II
MTELPSHVVGDRVNPQNGRDASGGSFLHWPTLTALLDQHAQSRPDHAAVVCGSDRLTYGQLQDRQRAASAMLAACQLRAGDRVLWLGQNCHRLLELVLAAAQLGASVCPVNWRNSAAEIGFVIDDLRPRVVVWQDEEIGDQVRAGRALAGDDAIWIQLDGTGPDGYEQMLVSAVLGGSPSDDAFSDSASYQIYTAAHDGRPGASQLTTVNLVAQANVIGTLFHSDADQVFLNSGPLFHIGTAQHMFATFVWGGTNVFARRSEAIELCRLIHEQRCTSAFLVAPQVVEMLQADPEARFDLTCLRSPLTMVPGWSDRVSADHSPWGRRIGGYGQTEVTGFCLYAALGSGQHSYTAGGPTPFSAVRIVDDMSNDLREGEVGEIVVSGALVHAGYWNRPEENIRRTRSGAWHTTDLGRRQPDGQIAFVGTATRIIKSAAENIYPAEVELCLLSHPAVQEAAVIGVPDVHWVQSVRAIIVLRDGKHVTEEEIIDYCRSKIASFKKPRSVVFAPYLPRAEGGIDYVALDAAHGGGAYVGNTTSHGH